MANQVYLLSIPVEIRGRGFQFSAALRGVRSYVRAVS